MHEIVIFKSQGRRFLCSGERLASGAYQAVVRFELLPDHFIRTLVIDAEHHTTSQQALLRAKELAEEWALTHPGYEQT